jgi:hypothetical protein
MEEKTNFIEEDTPFNMAMLFYIRLNKLLEAKGRSALHDDVHGWYKCLMEIYRTIIFKVNATDSKFVETNFATIEKLLYSSVQSSRKVTDQINTINSRKAYNILHETDCKLTRLMNRAGMIFPRVDAKGLQSIYQKYKLESETDVREDDESK